VLPPQSFPLHHEGNNLQALSFCQGNDGGLPETAPLVTGFSDWRMPSGNSTPLFAGALLGVVIVAQTLYSSTKEHLIAFATLRAIGSSSRYIHKVIIWQALISAVIGFSIAALIDAAVVRMTADTVLPIVITADLMVILFVLTLLMCIASSTAAIVKVTRIDPATVFAR
jgi:putative ABC transport system permease protein